MWKLESCDPLFWQTFNLFGFRVQINVNSLLEDDRFIFLEIALWLVADHCTVMRWLFIVYFPKSG